MTTLRVCVVGDSLVLGTNDDEYLGWPGRLAHREARAGHDISLYNLGIRADTSEMIAARWRAECEARLPEIHPGALVFSFGVNDMAIQDGEIRVPQERSLEIARAMMTKARDWKATLWIGPQPIADDKQPFRAGGGIEYYFAGDRTAALSDAYGELAGELGIPYLDLFTPLAATAEWDRMFGPGDGVHPIAAGYGMIAERITGWDAWRVWFDEDPD